MKKYVIIIIVAVIIFLLVPPISLWIILSNVNLEKEPYAVEKTIKTPYNDNFSVSYIVYNFPYYDIRFSVQHTGEEIFYVWSPGTVYYGTNLEERMDIIENSYSQGNMRVYEFCWGIVYSCDNGINFTGIPKHQYTDRYKADKEFAAIYKLLHAKPFYDERFANYLDTNKEELPRFETARTIGNEMPIGEVERLIGKAQRCVLIEMDESGNKVEYFTFEYDLFNGHILVIQYINRGEKENLEAYVSYTDIRDLYYSDSTEGKPSPSKQVMFSTPSSAAA